MDCYSDMILFEAFVAEFNVHVFLRGEPRNPVINLWMASKEGQVCISLLDCVSWRMLSDDYDVGSHSASVQP